MLCSTSVPIFAALVPAALITLFIMVSAQLAIHGNRQMKMTGTSTFGVSLTTWLAVTTPINTRIGTMAVIGMMASINAPSPNSGTMNMVTPDARV
ncbi:Uncharacterised protein [Enterobacter cloacae]|nr:Uncharacterised protein [Enterobacter cloacae]